MIRSGRSTTLLAAVMFVACRGGQLPDVVDVRDVATSHGQPEISSIIDLGAPTLPRQGRLLAPHRDGSAVIGELLLLEGSGFSKQPTVSVGGRAAAVLARVEGGGVVVRVPWGIDPGEVEVEVTTAGGRHSRGFPIRRVGLVTTGSDVWPLRIAADGSVEPGQPVPLPGAERLAISSEGVAAYVAGVSQGPRLQALDLTPAQPTRVHEHALQGSKVLALCTAEQAPLGLVVTDTHLHLFDTSDPLRPGFWSPVPLEPRLRAGRILAAALGGQGRLLALLLAESNQVAVVDLRDPARPGAPVFRDAIASPLSLVQDLHFSADEGSLWVVSGDGPRSLGSGAQPLRITLVQVQQRAAGWAPELSLAKSWELGGRGAPRQLAVARGEPIPPGTVIRAEPSASAVYLTVVGSDWLKPVAAPLSPTGAVLRTAPGRTTERLLEGPELLTSLDVVGRTQILLALGARAGEGGSLQRILVSRQAWEKGAPRVVSLDVVSSPGTPPWLGEVRAQP